jgi:hypothetical protein
MPSWIALRGFALLVAHGVDGWSLECVESPTLGGAGPAIHGGEDRWRQPRSAMLWPTHMDYGY